MLHYDLYLKVREIVNEADPISLMGICGEDEYSPEIKEIITLMDSCNDFAELMVMTIGVFERWFGGMSGPMEVQIKMAERLWKIKQEIKVQLN